MDLEGWSERSIVLHSEFRRGLRSSAWGYFRDSSLPTDPSGALATGRQPNQLGDFGPQVFDLTKAGSMARRRCSSPACTGPNCLPS